MKLIYGGPPALPGQCYLCAVASRDRYIDLETQVEFHGAMYLCDECLREMAQKLGMITEDQATSMNFQLLKLQEELEHSREESRTLKGVLDGYDDVRTFLDSDSLFRESDMASAQGEAGTSEGVRSGEEGSTESSDDEDVDGLQSSDASNEPGFSF